MLSLPGDRPVFGPLQRLAAPLSAVLLLAALFVLEERGFTSGSSLLLALAAAVAAAELVPGAAVSMALLALALQAWGVLPPVTVSGVLTYAAVPLALFFAARSGTALQSWMLPAAAALAAGLTTASWFTDRHWIDFVFGSQIYGRGGVRSLVCAFLVLGAFAAVNLAGWALGRAVYAASASRRAQLKAEAALRETATELALEQERNRIAAELHDVLAHSLAVIMSQADGIRYIHRTEPDMVETAAGVIAAAARTALLETRRLVEVYSSSGATAAADTNPVGLADIPALASGMGSSGLAVRQHSTGAPVPLTALQELAVYRLVQEGLTNAFKHGDRAAGADVRQTWTGAGLELAVASVLPQGSDAGTRPAGARPAGVGHGLPGMRARAAAAGGWVEATAGPDLFTLTAFFPSAAVLEGTRA